MSDQAKAEGDNPKQDQTQTDGDNAKKDPDDWVTGDEPMTGAQASYLKTLSEETNEPFDPSLNKAEASKRIDELRSRDARISGAKTDGR